MEFRSTSALHFVQKAGWSFLVSAYIPVSRFFEISTYICIDNSYLWQPLKKCNEALLGGSIYKRRDNDLGEAVFLQEGVNARRSIPNSRSGRSSFSPILIKNTDSVVQNKVSCERKKKAEE